MGLLVDGVWRDKWYDTGASAGEFVRDTARHRNWVTADGSPGPSGEGGFRAESGRYHLYVSYACPWAHRTLIFRALKGLEDHIGVSVVHPLMLADGWTFQRNFDGATGDRLMGKKYLRDVYLAADPRATGRVTVPVLWDQARGTIVSNESAEIIRMFNSAFDGVTESREDYYPQPLRAEIEAVNRRVYETVNNGVYRAGFALIRFDPVYVGHFKCNIRRIADYPALSGFVRELYQWPGVAATTRLDHIKFHYYASHTAINPTGIVPIGPKLDLTAPHGRGGVGG
jgi:putative glutathione S-transferase